MSLVFRNTTAKNGIVDLIYSNTGADSVKYPIEEVTRDINLAMDALQTRAIKASGKWQVDDYNHLKDPIITTNLVLGQRDYHFTVDEQSNLILDIYRVMVADSSGVYYDLELVDQQSPEWNNMGMVDGRNLQGLPSKYDKTANGIFLDSIPNYNYTNGIKIFYNRESSYFVSTDTTKKPGFDGRLHEYLAIRPTTFYAQRKGLQTANFWASELLKYEGDKRLGIPGLIEEIYSQRAKDEQLSMTPESINSK